MNRRTLYTVSDTPREVKEEFRREAAREGVTFLAEIGGYFLASADAPNLEWATDVSWSAYEVEIPSIAAGARNLKAAAAEAGVASPRWIRLDGLHHRRATLIADSLPSGETKPYSFRRDEPRRENPRPLAGFFLLAPERAVAIFDSLTPYPGGLLPFAEEKKGPPSRAYLKLWEVFARLEHAGVPLPGPGTTTVDLGSCPGGWTWALAERGATVESIDGAPLDPAVEKRPEVTFVRGDAFRLPPKKIDWVFSDMICEPKRLPELIGRWESVGCTRFVISVKFKGEADQTALAQLRSIPGGRLRHLSQNKHELTWFRIPELKRI